MTLAFDNQLSLPLTVASTQLDAPSSQNLHPDATVTVVFFLMASVLGLLRNRQNRALARLARLSHSADPATGLATGSP